MHKYILGIGLVILLLAVSSCGTDPEVQLAEISRNSIVYDEIVRLNNCGGKGDTDQVVTREFATTIEFGAGITGGYKSIVEGNISAKYSEYRNTSKSIRVVAPPGTNMEFVLRWSDDVRAGNVQVNGKSGTYEVRIPVSVEQISSRDLGCEGTISLPAPTFQLTIQTQSVPTRQHSPMILSIETLKRVLDETSSERVEVTLGRLRELCNQGMVICYDHPAGNWSVTGPALVATDPMQQPIAGARVVRVNKDSAGNWLPNWPIGLFYIPVDRIVVVPTPGIAYPLEAPLPDEWIVR